MTTSPGTLASFVLVLSLVLRLCCRVDRCDCGSFSLPSPQESERKCLSNLGFVSLDSDGMAPLAGCRALDVDVPTFNTAGDRPFRPYPVVTF